MKDGCLMPFKKMVAFFNRYIKAVECTCLQLVRPLTAFRPDFSDRIYFLFANFKRSPLFR